MQLQLLAAASIISSTCLAFTEQGPAQVPLHVTTPIASSASSDEPWEERLVSIYKRLLSYDSTTGKEKEIGWYLKQLLSWDGFQVEMGRVEEDRYNVYGYSPGSSGRDMVLLTSHMDTVPPYIPYTVEQPPNSSSTNTTTFWGRGTVDAKASIAAQYIAATNIMGTYSAHPATTTDTTAVALLFVVGEETHGEGMRYFSRTNPDRYSAVIFGEPTEGKLVCGHKGIMGLSLRVRGRAAHSGYPWLGLSANSILIAALSRLEALESKLPRSDKYGRTTLNVGKMDGGVASNVVAENATADITLRLAGGDPEEIKAHILRALEPVMQRASDEGAEFEIEWSGNMYAPVDVRCDVEGFNTTTVNYGTDVPNLEGEHDRYLYGPGSILLAHGPDEHLSLDELKEAVRAYERLIVYALDRAS